MTSGWLARPEIVVRAHVQDAVAFGHGHAGALRRGDDPLALEEPGGADFVELVGRWDLKVVYMVVFVIGLIEIESKDDTKNTAIHKRLPAPIIVKMLVLALLHAS